MEIILYIHALIIIMLSYVRKHFPSASKPLHAPFPVHSSSPLPGLLSFFIIEKAFLTPAPPPFFLLVKTFKSPEASENLFIYFSLSVCLQVPFPRKMPNVTPRGMWEWGHLKWQPRDLKYKLEGRAWVGRERTQGTGLLRWRSKVCFSAGVS